MSRFPNLCAPKSKRPLPNSRNNLAFGSMIPNPEFLCALDQSAPDFSKNTLPKFQLIPIFKRLWSQHSSNATTRIFESDWFFRRGKIGNTGIYLASLVMVIGTVKSWDNTTVRVKAKYPKGRLIENRLLYNDFVNA